MKSTILKSIKFIFILFFLVSVLLNGGTANAEGREDLDFYTNLGSGFNNIIYATAIQSDGKILVGGQFTDFNGNTRNRLVRLNSDGTEDTVFNNNLGSGFNVQVETISVQSDGKVLVGGQFTSLNGNTRNRLVRLNSDGTLDTSFSTNLGTGFGNVVFTTAVQGDGKILVGGFFSTFNGNTRNRLVRLNSNGTLDTSFSTNLGTGFTGVSDIVYTISVQSDGKILVGGSISTFNANTRRSLVRLNSDGTEDTAFYTNLGTSFLGRVETISIQGDGKIMVGGSFFSFNGNTRRGITRLNSDGTEDGAFSTSFPGGGNALAILIQSNGKMIVGGVVCGVGGSDASCGHGIVRLNSDGSLDPAFSTDLVSFNGLIETALIQSDGKILVGGQFTNFNGNTRNRLIRLVNSISYSGDFSESEINDGSVTGSRVATLSGDTFVPALTDGVHYTVTNVPAGLTAVMTRTSDTVATLTFTGNAVNSGSADSVSNLTITWLDGAFVTTATANLISGYTNNAGSIQFNNPAISYSGDFSESEINDGSVTGSRVATLSGDTFVPTLTEDVHYTITNVPTGLTAVMTRTSDTVATLTFTGNAVDNGKANSVSSLIITWLDGAFVTTATASDVVGYVNEDGYIGFIDQISSTNTEGTNIFLTYNVELDSESLPLPDDFQIYVNGNQITVESVTISGTVVTLTVSPAIFTGAEVFLYYYPENFGDPIIGLSGFYANTIEDGVVTNNSTVAPPGLSSISTNTSGTSIFLTYNVELDSESLPVPEDFEIYVNGDQITVESVSISGTTVTLIVSPSIVIGDSITLTYYPENYGSPIVGLSDFYADGMTDQVVTNNVQPIIVPSATPVPVQNSGPTAVAAAPLSISEIQKIFGNIPRPQATSTATYSVTNNQNNTNNTNTVNNGAAPASFTRNLQLNSRGEDVRNLQRFLNQNGFTVATTGAGSPGRETNLFGPATRRALIRYQQANNIRPAIGFFGAITRGFVGR